MAKKTWITTHSTKSPGPTRHKRILTLFELKSAKSPPNALPLLPSVVLLPKGSLPSNGSGTAFPLPGLGLGAGGRGGGGAFLCFGGSDGTGDLLRPIALDLLAGRGGAGLFFCFVGANGSVPNGSLSANWNIQWEPFREASQYTDGFVSVQILCGLLKLRADLGNVM